MNDHATALKEAMQIDGALGVALVDSNSGMALGTAGSPMDLDLEVAAAGNSSVVQAKLRTMADLGLQQSIEDILITLDKQYHIIRPLARQNTFFLYLVLDRSRANLAMARFKLAGSSRTSRSEERRRRLSPVAPRHGARPAPGRGRRMREQFTVDLRGLVEILSHHLYRNERVYLRELVQNAHDAIRARAALGHPVDGAVEIVPARGYEQLVVRDNGIGLTESDMRALLSIIGSTSKRSDVAAVRRQFLGQFGIGLLSCFLVADTIEVISRSARTPDAPTVRWVGESDGTFTIGPALEPLAEPGTEVRLRPRHGYYRWCDTEACTQFASEFAELLDVPVRIGESTLSQQPRPWTLPTEEQLAWCQERFGFEAMGIIPFDTQSAGVVGLAFVLPYTARPGYRTGDRIYSKGMLVADTDDLVIPRWAFFCRAVVDAGDLPLTASREGLQESGELQFVRKQIGFRLLTELIIVQGQHPDVYADIVRLHADGLKALAVQEPDVRDLLIATLPFETTLGERTIQKLLDGTGPVPFVRDADTYAALADVAAHAGVLVVNAGGLHEAELLAVANDEADPGRFREVTAAEVVELARPVPHPDAHAAAALAAKARAAIAEAGLMVDVGSFEPADRPVLWWPTTPGHARMVLNAANSAVKRLLTAPPEADLSAVLRALHVTGLLAGRATPTPAQVATLGTAVLDMVEGLLSDGR